MKAKYIILPVNNDSDMREVTFTRGGESVYSLFVKLNSSEPKYYSYVPTAFLGDGWEINLASGEFQTADALPADVYSEEFRPQTHFTPAQGWTNDPNGLIFYEGKYHLFFQHNPAGNQWGNMHWGHAVSSDLLHWKELEIALYPDNFGTMYSGSAICDERNVTGLKRGEHLPLLLFYTAAGKPFTQCMAFSTDGGRTFEKFDGNPIVPHIIGANRDPKVVWCPELDCYLMALYLDGNTYALLRSDDLIHWDEHQRFELPGDSECPDFYPLGVYTEALGGVSDEFTRWVFSGASDHYYIGGFEGGIFLPSQEINRLHEGPNTLYAAQTYSGVPGGRRIRLSWDTSNAAASRNMRWGCQMSVPADMSIRCIGDGLRLCCYPIPEFNSLRRDAVNAPAFDIEAEVCLEADASFKVFGIEAPFEMDAKNGGDFKLRVITDRTGFEAYFNSGEFYTARGGISDYSLPPLSVEGGKIESLKVYGLKSIH